MFLVKACLERNGMEILPSKNYVCFLFIWFKTPSSENTWSFSCMSILRIEKLPKKYLVADNLFLLEMGLIVDLDDFLILWTQFTLALEIGNLLPVTTEVHCLIHGDLHPAVHADTSFSQSCSHRRLSIHRTGFEWDSWIPPPYPRDKIGVLCNKSRERGGGCLGNTPLFSDLLLRIFKGSSGGFRFKSRDLTDLVIQYHEGSWGCHPGKLPLTFQGIRGKIFFLTLSPWL